MIVDPFATGPVIGPAVSVTELIVGATGGVVSTTAVTVPAVMVAPVVSVANAVKECVPSESGPVVKLQLPEPSIAAEPRSVEPSVTSTETMPPFTDPDSVSVLSFVTPPLEMLGLWPLSVTIVVLVVALGSD